MSDNKVSKDMDGRMQLILSVSDNSILRVLRVNNDRIGYNVGENSLIKLVPLPIWPKNFYTNAAMN